MDYLLQSAHERGTASLGSAATQAEAPAAGVAGDDDLVDEHQEHTQDAETRRRRAPIHAVRPVVLHGLT